MVGCDTGFLTPIEKTLAVLENMKFKTMTPIQAKAIPALLSGKDVLGAAKYTFSLVGYSLGRDRVKRLPSLSPQLNFSPV